MLRVVVGRVEARRDRRQFCQRAVFARPGVAGSPGQPMLRRIGSLLAPYRWWLALVLVTDKLAKRDAEFGSPKYKHSRVTVRDQMAAHKGSLAGDRVGFAKPIRSADGQAGG